MYKNSFSRKTPGLVIMLIDQSGSMGSKSVVNGQSLAQNAADSVNKVINEFILKLTDTDEEGGESIKASMWLTVIGYGGGIEGDEDAYFICDDMIDKVSAKFPTRKRQMVCREGFLDTECIEVLEPVAGCDTPMASAFRMAKTKIEEWHNNHSNVSDPVPVVINISDGAPYSESAGETEDDVKKCADEIRRISFPDGTPRIFNIHISPNGEKDVRFPATNSNLDSYAAFLFDISSEVTPDLVVVIPELMQYHVSGNEKTMMSNVSDPEALAQFLRIGTLPKLR